jgi:hypothetical protein
LSKLSEEQRREIRKSLPGIGKPKIAASIGCG